MSPRLSVPGNPALGFRKGGFKGPEALKGFATAGLVCELRPVASCSETWWRSARANALGSPEVAGRAVLLRDLYS